MMVSDEQRTMGFILSGGEASDAREGRLLLDAIGRMKSPDNDRPLYLLILNSAHFMMLMFLNHYRI
jgi:hypothetical protein